MCMLAARPPSRTGLESTIEYYKGIECGVQQKSGASWPPVGIAWPLRLTPA